MSFNLNQIIKKPEPNQYKKRIKLLKNEKGFDTSNIEDVVQAYNSLDNTSYSIDLIYQVIDEANTYVNTEGNKLMMQSYDYSYQNLLGLMKKPFTSKLQKIFHSLNLNEQSSRLSNKIKKVQPIFCIIDFFRTFYFKVFNFLPTNKYKQIKTTKQYLQNASRSLLLQIQSGGVY